MVVVAVGGADSEANVEDCNERLSPNKKAEPKRKTPGQSLTSTHRTVHANKREKKLPKKSDFATKD